ncbi:hypothetical protein WJX79_006542 [Trebouxia sp. C0005]
MQLSCTASQARSGRYRTADALSQQATASFRPRRLTSIGLAGSHCLTACWRTHALPQKAARRQIHATYPEPETEKERSPLDYPQEWITPQPSRRPDPVPDFEKLDTPKIRPLPGDPEQPDEEEEEEEEKKKKEKEDPDKDKPDPSQDPPE